MTYLDPNMIGEEETSRSQMVKNFISLALFAGLAGWLIGVASGPAFAQPFMEQNTDRRGGDYRTLTMKGGGPDYCAQECAKDGQCQAWTYIRPGNEGSTAVCRLKQTVPFAENSPCCISGVRVGASLATYKQMTPPPMTPKPLALKDKQPAVADMPPAVEAVPAVVQTEAEPAPVVEASVAKQPAVKAEPAMSVPVPVFPAKAAPLKAELQADPVDTKVEIKQADVKDVEPVEPASGAAMPAAVAVAKPATEPPVDLRPSNQPAVGGPLEELPPVAAEVPPEAAEVPVVPPHGDLKPIDLRPADLLN